MGNLDWLRRISQIADGTEFSSYILDAILIDPDLKSQTSIDDQKNISISSLHKYKRPAKSIIEILQNQRKYNFEKKLTGDYSNCTKYQS